MCFSHTITFAFSLIFSVSKFRNCIIKCKPIIPYFYEEQIFSFTYFVKMLENRQEKSRIFKYKPVVFMSVIFRTIHITWNIVHFLQIHKKFKSQAKVCTILHLIEFIEGIPLLQTVVWNILLYITGATSRRERIKLYNLSFLTGFVKDLNRCSS